MEKKAGILLHISSLPSENIGTLGEEAYNFVDFLYATSQKLWQVLPINPTSYGDSPYQSSSVNAFNPYFISFEELVKDGLLTKGDYEGIDFGNGIDYKKLFDNKINVLKKTYKNMDKFSKEFTQFKNDNNWLDDFAIYTLIKEKKKHRPWYEWEEYRIYDFNKVFDFSLKYSIEVDEVKFIQFLFYRQWMKLKKYANDKGIKIIGDLPIYVAYDSVDVWKTPELFQLNENLIPISVAGCPPDYFSVEGQLWGNPLYDWEYLEKYNFKWWVDRIKKTSLLYDILRIDHFRGFAGYFSIPYGKKPIEGKWRKGPGYKLFEEINKNVDIEIIAENLGFLDDEVRDLLENCGYAGMRVLQFEFGEKLLFKEEYPYNNVLYTGTHDNENLLSWYEGSKDKRKVKSLCKIPFMCKNPHIKIIEAAMDKECKYVIVPIQDYLGLKDERMNIPSVVENNWLYQMKAQDIDDKLIELIKTTTEKAGRN